MSASSDSYKNARLRGVDNCADNVLTIPEQAANLRAKIINNKPELVKIADLICINLKIKSLSQEELIYVVRNLRQFDYMKLVHLEYPQIIRYISSILAKDIAKYKCTSNIDYDAQKITEQYNMKQEQYEEITKNTKTDGVKPTGIEKEYYQKQILEFNSRYKSKDPNATSEFRFAVSSTGARALGLVRALDEITNIRSMKIFPFSIPYNTQADSYFGRIGLHIKELSQGVRTFNAKDFHFNFKTTVNGNRIDLEPVIDTFNFPQVIYQLTDATLVFRNQYNEVLFDAGEIDQATFTDLGAGVMEVNSVNQHNLSTGDLVAFENFTFGGVLTVQDNELVREQGHFITVVDANRFTVNVDMSTSLPPDDNWNIVLVSKQFIIDIEFEYIRGRQEGHLYNDNNFGH
jgi:hypothetical protein